MMIVSKHLAAVQILIPFFAALIAAISSNRTISWMIATFSMIISLAIAIYGMGLVYDGMSYSFGGFPPPIGIEYRLDYLNQPIIIFVNFVIVFFLVCGRKIINLTIMNYITPRKQNYFYSILLFSHAGYLGVLSTNDLFNLYVFIEISSLATYVLMSKGKNKLSVIGAFDYLVLGTIGATLILISIGFFLSMTGSLNITDIANILKGSYDSRVITIAIVFFLTGAILKMAFFPMHFWMIRAYSSSPPFILTYLASISGILGTYMIVRFIFFTVEGAEIQQAISDVLRPLAMFTIIICTFLALKVENFKKVIIYSAASQVGYIFLLMTIWTAKDLMFILIILDGLNKIALFTIVALIEDKSADMRFDRFKHIDNSGMFRILSFLALLFSASLPLTSMFMVKIQLFEILIHKQLIMEFLVVVIGSVLALLYHFKLGIALFFSPRKNGTIQITNNYLGLFIIVSIQFLTLIFINEITEITKYTESIVLLTK